MPQFYLNQKGMTLIEVTVAAGLVSLVALGAGVSMLRTNSALDRSQGTAMAAQTQMQMNRWLSLDPVNGSASCAQTLQIPQSALTIAPTSPIPVQITDPTQPLKVYAAPSSQDGGAGGVATTSTLSGNGKFNITKLYLDDTTYVKTEGTGNKVYTSTLWLEGAIPNQSAVYKRAITALTITRDSTGQIVDCNSVSSESSQSHCQDLSGGFEWSGSRCVSSVQRQNDGTFTCGSSGLGQTSAGPCAPSAIACASGTIAQGFTNAAVTGCTTYQ